MHDVDDARDADDDADNGFSTGIDGACDGGNADDDACTVFEGEVNDA